VLLYTDPSHVSVVTLDWSEIIGSYNSPDTAMKKRADRSHKINDFFLQKSFQWSNPWLCGVAVITQRRGGCGKLVDPTGALKPRRTERVEQKVVITGGHDDNVDVRHKGSVQNPHGRTGTVGCFDLLDHWFADVRPHETDQVAVLADRYVATCVQRQQLLQQLERLR